MASTMVLYGQGLMYLMGEGSTTPADLEVNTWKVALFTASYSPSQDNDTVFSGLSGEVAAGNGYSAGGNSLNAPTTTYTPASNTTKFDADDPTMWTASSSGFSFRYIVTYNSSTGALLGYNDYGSTLTLNAGDTFTFTFDSAGIVTWSVT